MLSCHIKILTIPPFRKETKDRAANHRIRGDKIYYKEFPATILIISDKNPGTYLESILTHSRSNSRRFLSEANSEFVVRSIYRVEFVSKHNLFTEIFRLI